MKKKSIIFLAITLSVYIILNIVSFLFGSWIESRIFKEVPREIDKLTVEVIEGFENKDVEKLMDLSHEEFRTSLNSSSEIADFVDMYSKYGNNKGLDLVGYHINIINGNKFLRPTYEIEYDDFFIIMTLTYIIEDSNYSLYRFDMNEQIESLRNTYKFRLLNQSLKHYMFLLIAIITGAFSLFTAAHSFGSDRSKRILWTIFVLFGVCVLQFNWTTGSINFNILSVGIPTIGYSRAGTLAPVILYLRIPIIAIIYWITYRRNKKEENVE